MILVTVSEMPCLSDMMKPSWVQELQGPSCKLKATIKGTLWAAVDTRWYSMGCYLARGLDCNVKQFWHWSCPYNAWLLFICTRFGELGLQIWWPLSLTRTLGQLWLGSTSSQATPWLLLTSPIPWWEQQWAAPPAHQPPPLTPCGKRECGLTFHPGEEMELQEAGGNTKCRSLVLPGAGKGNED